VRRRLTPNQLRAWQANHRERILVANAEGMSTAAIARLWQVPRSWVRQVLAEARPRIPRG